MFFYHLRQECFWFAVFFLVFIFESMKNSQLLSVSNIKQETIDSVVVSFDVGDQNAQNYKFKAGQYLTLTSKINGQTIKRSYSICSSPQSQKLQVGVKALKMEFFKLCKRCFKRRRCFGGCFS